MDTAALTLVLTLAVASIVMVFALVQFTAVIIADPDQPSAIKGWGLLYAATWCVIVAVIVRGAILSGASWPQTFAVATLVAGGWGTFQAFWVWLWLSIDGTNARAVDQATALTGKEAIRRRAGQIAAAGLIAVALATIELGYVREALASLFAPGHRALSATLTVGVIGSALLIVGGVRLVLSRGEPMSHAEIEGDIRRGKYGSRSRTGLLRVSGSAYRHFGPAKGATATQELSIAAMKDAWRSGEWRREHMWQTVFMMAGGGLMMFAGGFGGAVIAGPPLVKVLCGGALAYTTFQLVAAVRRA